MGNFLFQCIKKDDLKVNISDNQEFNEKVKSYIISMKEGSLIYNDKAPLFALTPFVQVSIKESDDEYYVFVVPDYHYQNFERFIPTLRGIFFDYDESNDIISFYNSSNNELLLSDYLKNIFSLEKNPFQVNKKDFSNFVLAMQNALLKRKRRLDISFKSSIEKKTTTYVIESSYENNGHMLGYLRNIDSYAREITKLNNIANKDPLTGCYSKNVITSKIKDVLSTANLKDKYMIGIIDIDFFKNINDTYGHLFGDEILIEFTKSLTRVLGKRGLVGRIGGDEFLFIYPVKSNEEEDIKVYCRKIIQVVRQLRFTDVSTFTLKTTMGISCFPKDGLTYDELFVKADKALYRGKIKGRDCYIIFNPENHGALQSDNNQTFSGLPERRKSDATLISEFLDSLINTDDLEAEINNVIKKTVNHFRIDRMTISDPNLNVLFQYSRDNRFLNQGYQLFKDKEYLKLFTSDNMLQITDIIQLRFNNPNITENYSNMKIKSLVQIILYNNGKISGFISFDMYLERRAWMPEELMYFNIISKIISGFFYKFQLERKLKDVSRFDELTNLLTLNYFKELVVDSISNDQNGVLLSFDIHKFRFINESKGYGFGSKLLQDIANNIRNIDKDDLICRLHDDVFLIYTKYVSIEEINRKFELVKFFIKNVAAINNIRIKLAQGAVIFNSDDKLDFQALIDRALEAKKYSKDNEIKTLVIYDNEIHQKNLAQQKIEEKMITALENREFEVYLQPCYELKSNTISSFEALVRWHSNEGLLSPGQFIPLFEKNGFILKLDFYVYETVCQTLANWKKLGYELKRISVNVSRGHINDDDFVNKLNDLLDKYDVEKKYFGIEITESLFMQDEDAVISLVEKLSNEGYHIYMDDFGVAYSTLNLLSRIHVDVIKLDRGFIKDDFSSKRETIVIRNIIQMARELGIDVLSEGIETKKQALELRNLKCDYAQGFYYQKPIPIKEIEKLYF